MSETPEPTTGPDELDLLKGLLVEEEKREIADLRERVEQRRLEPGQVAEALPDAILLRGARDDRLGRALAPTIDDAIQESVKRDPSAIADAIFPVIGPAIRKAIRQALAQIVETLNTTVEHSLTLRGLSWRFEAWRTKRPFAEVVLAHSLVWRVEQVFLIHAETGLVLEEVSTPTGLSSDPDLVSSMLTAIQDFCADSFHTAEERPVHAIDFDEFEALVASGPRAVLAAIVRGQPPRGYRDRLDEAIEAVHARFARQLDRFEGETDAFLPARPILEDCFDQEERQKRRALPAFLPVAVACAAVLALAVYASVVLLDVRADRRAARSAFAALDATPGIFVGTQRSATAGDELAPAVDWVVEGLRDPDSDDPAEVLRRAGFDPERVAFAWEPIRSFAPALVARRAARILDAPPSVRFTLVDRTLVARGVVPPDWLRDARARLVEVDGADAIEVAE